MGNNIRDVPENESYEMEDRPVLEIEITPAMIAAGAEEVMIWAYDLVSGDARLSGQAAAAVFVRMLKSHREFPV